MAPENKRPHSDYPDVRGSRRTADRQPHDTTSRAYTVADGDTLRTIAERELGDPGKWRAIYEANEARIKDSDQLQPGQVLNLPADHDNRQATPEGGRHE